MLGKIELYKNRWAQQASAVDKDKISKYENDEHWMEAKLDGYRSAIEVTGNGVRVVTRLNNEKTGNCPHIEDMFKDLPVGTVVDGEFGYPSAYDDDGNIIAFNFEQTSKVMASGSAKAVDRQKEWGPLTFVIFDVLQYGDKIITDEPQSRRRLVAEKIRDRFRISSKSGAQFITISAKYPVNADFLDQIKANGGEGIMIKNADAPYNVGKKRVGSWYKAKLVESAEAVVIGFTEAERPYTGRHQSKHPYWYDVDRGVKVLTGGGRPKKDDYPNISENLEPVTKYWHNDWIGAIEFGQLTDKAGKDVVKIGDCLFKKRGQCSGITEELRKEITRNKDEFIGRVIEVKHYGIGSDDGFRHPQYKCFRDDKAPADCSWDEAI